jgi:hypothetical protein
MKERLEIDIEYAYKDVELISRAKVMKGKALVSEWHLKDYKSLIHNAIDSASQDEVFEALKIKRKTDEVMKLFEPKKITIQSK